MDYRREYPLFSACGLNCGLCPRYYTDGDSKCPGCGGENFSEKHCSCSILPCIQRKGVEYCYLCDEYPCKKYDNWERDSFITHQNMMKDFEKAKRIGIEAYKEELNEKVKMLEDLLANYNDGRRKSFFCIAVNLLELNEVKCVLEQLGRETELSGLMVKEKSVRAVALFQAIAQEKNVVLKLNRK